MIEHPARRGTPTTTVARRWRGDDGAGLATALVLLFAFTVSGVVWLARDVDRAISNRGAAQSIAFQAARTGAQQIDLVALRSTGAVVIDEPAARTASAEVAERLLAAYELDGRVVRITVAPDRVEVEVQVTDGGRTVIGIGGARAADREDGR